MIDRRDFVKGLVGAAGTASTAARPTTEKLNVLFIAVDDLRPDLGCYGNPSVRSPNLDRLAKSSVLFHRAYCQSPVCGPSRASILTGLRPDTTRVWGNKTHFREIRPNVVTLPQQFKRVGYHTEAIGKVLHGKMDDPGSWSVPVWPPGGLQAGMQYVDIEALSALGQSDPGRVLTGEEIPTLEWKKRTSWQAPEVPDNALQDGEVADRAVGALRELQEKPFFLAVGFQKPHLPFTAPKRYFDLYDPDRLPIPRDPQRPVDSPDLAFTNWQELRGYTDIPRTGPLPPGKARELVHGYYAATSYMDAQLGRILGELDRLELADHTVIVVFGDHGWHLGEQQLWAKTTNFELAARVPLMIRVPGMMAGGRGCDGIVELIDMFPTLCDACGVASPQDLEGTSMLPLTDDPQSRWKSAAFTQIPRPYLADQDWKQMGYSMRTERYRFTEWADRDSTVVARELYDLGVSPIETVNLAVLEENRPLIQRLSEQLHQGRPVIAR